MNGPPTRRLRDRYEPLEITGQGGQGEVFKALDHFHNRLVAIKVRTMPTVEDREAFLQEASVLLELEPHAGFPVVRDDFFEDDRYHLVMDWIEGTDLDTLLRQRGDPGLPYKIVIRYVKQVAETLDHLHAQDPPVVHKDVKPANLILTPKQRVVLVDFGIAGIHHRGQVMGTPNFVAPEILSGDPPTPAADIFGLAATTYTLLTGSPPRGDARNWEDVPRESIGAVEHALGRALSIDPARRPGSAEELVERLRARLDRADTSAAVDHREVDAGDVPVRKRLTAKRVASVAAIMIVAVGAALEWLVLGPSDPGSATVPVNSVARIDVGTGSVTDAVEVGRMPTTVVAAGGSVWVANLSSKTVTRIEASSGRSLGTIAAGGTPIDLSAGPEAIWIANELEGTVVRIDPSSGDVTTTLQLPAGTKSIAASGEATWVTNAFDRTLTQINPRTDTVVSSLRLPGIPADVAVGFGSVWVSELQPERLLRIDLDSIDLESPEVDSIALRAGADQIAIGDDAVWVSSPPSNQVFRVDPVERTSTAIEVGNTPAGITVDAGNVWVANYLDGTITRIDENDNRVVETVRVGNSPEGVIASEDYLWVTVHAR